MRLPFLTKREHEAAVARATQETQMQILSGIAAAMPKGEPHAAYKLDNPWAFVSIQTPTRKPTQAIDTRTLRRIADTVDPLRAAIQQIKREVRDAKGQVVPRDAKERKMSSPATLARVKQAEEFFKRSGGNGGVGKTRNAFEAQWLEDLLVIGAFAVYRERNLGGSFQQYAIDSATIMPRIDSFGWDALKPFSQWIDGREVRTFDPEELVYDGIDPRSWTPYFVSPIEWLLSPLTSYGKLDEWNRVELTDGTAPGNDVFTISKDLPLAIAQQWKDAFDAVNSGNAKERQKIKILPEGSQRLSVGTRKEQDYAGFELQLITRICSIYGVQPASIGYAGEQYKVSQEGSHDQTSKYGVGSVLEKRKELYDDTLEVLGFDDLEWVDVSDAEEDELSRAQRLALAVGKPWLTRNEARAIEGEDPIEGWDEEDVAPAPDPVELAAATAQAKAVGKTDPKAQRAAEALNQWRGICLKRLARGQSAAYDFKTEDLTDSQRSAILTRLESVLTEEDVRREFDKTIEGEEADGFGPDLSDEGDDEEADTKGKSLWLLLLVQIEAASKAFAHLSEGLTLGTESVHSFAQKAIETLRPMHVEAARLGALRAGMSETAAEMLSHVVGQKIAREQEAFLENLGRQIQNGELSEAQIAQRFEAFGQRVVGTANEAWRLALPKTTLIRWRDTGDAAECDVCPHRAANGPYTADTLPSVPGDCSTPCLTRCRCYLETEGGETSFYDPRDNEER